MPIDGEIALKATFNALASTRTTSDSNRERRRHGDRRGASPPTENDAFRRTAGRTFEASEDSKSVSSGRSLTIQVARTVASSAGDFRIFKAPFWPQIDFFSARSFQGNF
ncbi:hypothetical protein L596_018622 [Steinernema carpocapsae]|uniref:Uncharacterized protein n=1 Tax=Steinernema carpocapsae TaxID=34508 RepID=A0A4U5N5N8_STECR|nr:hypothetical protein L596_018622 [Steinernema carpocapsae]